MRAKTINKSYQSRDFYKLDDQGKKVLSDMGSGDEFPFQTWYEYMGMPTKREMIKEIQGHIDFMKDEIEEYQKGVDGAYSSYSDPEGMKEFFRGKLERAQYMKDYWEYVLDAAYEFYEDLN